MCGTRSYFIHGAIHLVLKIEIKLNRYLVPSTKYWKTLISDDCRFYPQFFFTEKTLQEMDTLLLI